MPESESESIFRISENEVMSSVSFVNFFVGDSDVLLSSDADKNILMPKHRFKGSDQRKNRGV